MGKRREAQSQLMKSVNRVRTINTHDNHECAVLSPLAIQAENLQVLDVVDTLQPGHVVVDQVVGGDVRRPVGLEEVPQLDQRVLGNLDELVIAGWRCRLVMGLG